MATETLYPLNSDLKVTLKTLAGDAYSFSLNIKSFIKALIFLAVTFFLFFVGTLFFFKELENSRKLEERLLSLEMKSLFTDTSVSKERNVAIQVSSLPAKITQATPDVKVESEAYVAPRVQEFIADCQVNQCNVQVSLVPSHSGIAQGELLIVLETEVPRIGTAGGTSNIRKRFFLYPGNESRDDLEDEQLASLTKKPFRFSKALHASAEFTIEELLHPIAASLYLYDSNAKLIHHERKSIRIGENNAQ